MVNVLSVVCFSALLLSNFVAASTDGHVRRSRHHNAARVGSIQRRAAEDHHAILLADRSVPEAPSAHRKRANGRCSARTSTSSLITSTTTSAHKTSSAVQTTTPIANPGGDPTTKAEPTTTPHTTTTTKKPVAKPVTTTSEAATTTKASSGGGGGGSGSGTVFHGDGMSYLSPLR